MSVLYHLTIPRSPIPSLDAVVQEVEALRTSPGDEIVYLNPARRPGSRYPERLYGLHLLPFLRRREVTVRLHHVFNTRPVYFPYMRWLRRPIIYTISAGLSSQGCHGDIEKLQRLSAIIVSSQRDRTALQEVGLRNVHVIRPGIDTKQFTPAPIPAVPGFTLLAGSAPWTVAQFRNKGVDALLAAAERKPDLRLVFLWRGLLLDEMKKRVAQRHLEDRVQVINHRVDVNRALSTVHAAVVLATDPTLVKAFPHSLIESLAAGRPVLLSAALPMADYVAQTGCGQIVETVSPDGVLAGLAQLETDYESCHRAALQVGQRDFSLAAFVRAHRQLYDEHMPD